MDFFRARFLRRTNSALIIAAAGAAAVLAFVITAGERPPTEVPREVSAEVSAEEEEAKPLEYYAAIGEKNLFGLPPRRPPRREPEPRPEPERPRMPGLKLRGTVLFSSGRGYAVVEIPAERREETVRTGETIAGMELVSLGWNSALFRGEPGELELVIDESAAEAPAAVRAGRTSPPPRAPGAERFTVTRGRFEEIVRDPARLLREIQVRPNFSGGGPEGFVVSGIRPGSIPAEFGLQDGDVVRSVNRVLLDSPEKVMDVYTQVMERGAATVEVVRNGRTVNLRYSIER